MNPVEPSFIYRVVVCTLAVVIVAVVCSMLYGLFDERVDNEQIFSILGPAFQTIVGVFCGILGARTLSPATKDQSK